MCIHMDNFLYGVLQSIADYGIETWKISLLAFYRYCYLNFFDLLQNMDRDPYLVEHSSMIACMMAQGAN